MKPYCEQICLCGALSSTHLSCCGGCEGGSLPLEAVERQATRGPRGYRAAPGGPRGVIPSRTGPGEHAGRSAKIIDAVADPQPAAHVPMLEPEVGGGLSVETVDPELAPQRG